MVIRARHYLLFVALLLLLSLLPGASLSAQALAAPVQAPHAASVAAGATAASTLAQRQAQQGNLKTVICHRTNGANPFVRIVVSSAAAAAGHQAHPGDLIGPAGDETFQCPNGGDNNTGTLKICKVLAAGTTAPAGTLFTFTVGTVTVRVAPGTCVLVPGVAVGAVLVTETGANGFEVVNIRTLAGTCTPTGANVGNATTCTIVRGQTTEVEFTNKEQKRGALKVCKDLAAGTTVPAGTLFTFTVDGRTVSVAPGTCVLVENLAVGTVRVTETGPAGYEVIEIRVLAGTCTPAGANVGNATTCTIVAERTTEVLFVNRVAKGFIQICKETVEPVTAPVTFPFTSSGFTGTQSITVNPGATQPVCGPLTQVNAGEVTVTEGAVPNWELVSVRTAGPGTCTLNLATRTATCTIPPGNADQQTQIIFRNRLVRFGFIQICKETEGGLTGAFGFTSPAFTGTQTINVTAGATQPVCGPLTRVISGTVAITELALAGTTLVSVRTAGPGTCTLNLATRTASCAIPPGNEAQQTQIIFRNRRT